MTFAGEFFTEEIERQSHFVLFKLESALYSPHAIKPEKMSRSFLAVVACKHVFPAVTGKTSGFAGYNLPNENFLSDTNVLTSLAAYPG